MSQVVTATGEEAVADSAIGRSWREETAAASAIDTCLKVSLFDQLLIVIMTLLVTDDGSHGHYH